jgi:peptidoglycan lytic transglycosylase G
MADVPPYVRHRSSPVARRASALVGLVAGAALLLGVVWVAAAWEGGSDPPPPPPPPPPAAPAKPTLRIIFPEGFTREEMAERIGEVNKIAKRKRKITPRLRPKTYLRLTKEMRPPRGFPSVPHLEGFLFPATYEFTAATATRDLVELQLEAFDKAWKELDLGYARSKRLNAYDVLIIASMIEKEVQVARERPLVAAVIYNRLKIDMSLGIDATLRYGLDIPPTESIRESQLEDPTPYNTRLNAGLPPTPIGNPGLASLQAAAHPAEVDYLYFVRNADCKTHFFTASAQEFEARVAAPRC